jgi:hypothetical protein
MLTLFFANIVGWIYANKRILLIFAAIFIVFIAVVIVTKSCGRKKASIDQEALQKINSANRAERTAELQKVIEDNAAVVQTVGNRSTIAETNVVERERKIAEKVAEADKAVIAAKAQGRDITGPELECLLIPENICK